MLLQTKIANIDQNKYLKKTHLAMDRCALAYTTKNDPQEWIHLYSTSGFSFLLWSFTSLCLSKLSDFVHLIAAK